MHANHTNLLVHYLENPRQGSARHGACPNIRGDAVSRSVFFFFPPIAARVTRDYGRPQKKSKVIGVERANLHA